jgi:hypothetical protein
MGFREKEGVKPKNWRRVKKFEYQREWDDEFLKINRRLMKKFTDIDLGVTPDSTSFSQRFFSNRISQCFCIGALSPRILREICM